MSLFNPEIKNLENKIFLEMENTTKAYKTLASTLMCEDNYSEIVQDNSEIIKINDSLNPEKWSPMMELFMDRLRSFIENNDESITIRSIQADLARIPIENIEERLTAVLEFYKCVLAKDVNLSFTEFALQVLEQSTDLYLKSRPNSEVIEGYVEKINFIKEIVKSKGIQSHFIHKLFAALDRLEYKFIDYGYEQTRNENLLESLVAQIAPVIRTRVPANIDPYVEPDYVTKNFFDKPEALNSILSVTDIPDGSTFGPMTSSGDLYHTSPKVGSFEKLGVSGNKYSSPVEKILIKDARHLFTEAWYHHVFEENCKVIEKEVFNESISGVFQKVKKTASDVVDKLDSAYENAFEKVFHSSSNNPEKTKIALRNSGWFSQKFSSMMKTAAVVLGAATLGRIEGLLALCWASSSFKEMKQKERERLLSRLEEERIIVREKIADNTGEKKYILMRLQHKIDKAINAIRRGEDASVDDNDLLGFTTDEDRLMQKAERRKKEREEYYRREDESEGYDYDKDKKKPEPKHDRFHDDD